MIDLDMPGFGTEWFGVTGLDMPGFGTVTGCCLYNDVQSAEIPPFMAAASLKMEKLTHVWDQYVTDWDVPGFCKE